MSEMSEFVESHAEPTPSDAVTVEGAFTDNFPHLWARVIHYAAKRVGSLDAAEEIAGETFAKAYDNRDKFTDQGIGVAPWVYKIARHTIINTARKNARIAEYPLDPEGEVAASLPAAEAKMPEQAVLDNDSSDRLTAKLVHLLGAKRAAVIIDRYVNDYSVEECMKRHDIPRGTVVSRSKRGLDILRRLYEANEDPLGFSE